jgi:filamentous hemagglutinin
VGVALRIALVYSTGRAICALTPRTPSAPSAPSRSYVPLQKLTGYLLALGHPVGGPKAWYFESRGYTVAAPLLLERAILDVARDGSVTKEEATSWGTKYVVSGEVSATETRCPWTPHGS